MARQIDVSVTLTKLEDGEQVDQLVTLLNKVVTDVIRGEVTVAAGALEASFKPPGIGTIELLYITSDQEITVRTTAAGSQYVVPAGGMLLFVDNAADLDDILITGAANPANVTYWVTEA